jgi:hypothetical protein
MLSAVEAWWADLCALPFDGTQGDSPLFRVSLFLSTFSWAITLWRRLGEALTSYLAIMHLNHQKINLLSIY